MHYLDKRDSNGLLLTYSAFALANKISVFCFKKTQETSIYKILKENFESEYLEIYFKKLYYENVIPIAHKIVINEWELKNNKNPNLHKINIRTFLANKYLEDFLILNKIRFTNNNDRFFIKKKILEFLINLKSLLKNIKIKYFKKNKKNKNFSESIGVSYCDGIDPDKRSDLCWLENSGIDPKDIVLYFDYHTPLNKFEKKENLYDRINKYKINKIEVRDWHDDSKVNFIEDSKKKIKNLEIKKVEEKQLKKISFELLKKVKFWYLFFKSLNIKIILDHNEIGIDNITKQLALYKLDGCSVGKLRSHIGKNSYDFLGFYPNDVFFTPSKDSANRLINHSLNKFKHVLISGFPQNLFTENNLNELNQIKGFFKGNKKNFIILLLDAAHSENKTFSYTQMIPTKLLDDFYVSILNKLSQFEDIGVIIKSKRLNSFKNLKNAYKLSLNLKERGITYIVEDPFQKNPSLYSNISDLVIGTGIFYPSALIDCCLKKKKKGIFFDIANLKSIESDWYNWAEKKVIFNNIDELSENILQYKNGQKNNTSFGNWENQKDILDPYQDDLGSKRIGKYLNTLLKGFKNKLSSSEAISAANSEFVKVWGKDKILN